MFGKKDRMTKYAEIYSGTRTSKLVKRKGAVISFEFSPHPVVGKLVRSAAIYVIGLGVIVFPTVVDGDLEKGIPATNWDVEADKILKGTELIVGLKYSDEIVNEAKALILSGVHFNEVEALINNLIRRSVASRGIIIQPCTGYNPAELVSAMSPQMREALLKGAAKEQAPQGQPPGPPASAEQKDANSQWETIKKKFH